MSIVSYSQETTYGHTCLHVPKIIFEQAAFFIYHLQYFLGTCVYTSDMTSPSRKDHDHQRFAAWGREYGPAVWGYLLAMVRRADVADDLTQEVFCKAWQARDRYREEGNARAYLLRIADRFADRSWP